MSHEKKLSSNAWQLLVIFRPSQEGSDIFPDGLDLGMTRIEAVRGIQETGCGLVAPCLHGSTCDGQQEPEIAVPYGKPAPGGSSTRLARHEFQAGHGVHPQCQDSCRLKEVGLV